MFAAVGVNPGEVDGSFDVVTSVFGIEPYWAAVGGAVVLGVHALAAGLIRPLGVARAVDVPFLCFVVGLAVVVRAVVDNGLGDWI